MALDQGDLIPPSNKALREALGLSEVILANIELSELPLANIALKASRLARLLNDFSFQKIMEYEASGYPQNPDGLAQDIFALAVLSGRKIEIKDDKTKEKKTYVYVTSIEELEQDSRLLDTALAAAKDPDISIASSNPHQHVWNPVGNAKEREALRANAALAQKRLSSRRSFIYSYVLQKHHELKFSGIADDIFSRVRDRVDAGIGNHVPGATQKLTAVYDNLQSESTEDWSNAVHGCRRILQDLADAIYPARGDAIVDVGGKSKTIKLGPDNYVNRLIAFLQERSGSERFTDVVGSHLSFVGDRLDSVFKAAQKGSHANIVSREEADRFVVYTYLVIGDILSLREPA